MYILVFIIILALLVLIHEFGHFIAAKKSGVKVEEFGFGFPPRVFGFKFGETLYSINLFPIGGFVRLFGEEYEEATRRELTPELKERTFVYKKPWQKVLIVVAGIIGNFLLGWILISFLFTQGVPSPTNNVIVERVQTGSPAAQVGLKPGDTILSIQKGTSVSPLKTTNDLITLTKKYSGQEIVMKVKQPSGERDIKITPRANPPAGQGSLGVVVTSFIEKKYPWYQAPFYGLVEAFNITRHIVVELVKVLAQLVTFQKPQVDVTGPIGIAQFTDQAIKFGPNAVLELTALLSLNLAVVNILPFPALDGGRLVLILYEWVTRKRVNQTFERYLNLVGIIILLALSAIISINDVIRIWR